MTDNEINIAIAKACGWWGIEQEGMMRPPLNTSEYKMVPDYCHDLNAMAQAEIAFDQDKAHGWHYWRELAEVVGADDEEVETWERYRLLLKATARQRAEAFLRVKGLWK